jgi:hypothetical protein
MPEPLQQERQFFSRMLPKWLNACPGRVVLVKGERLIGIFDTEEEAIEENARLHGLESALVRRVTLTTEEIHIPALDLGMLCAHPEPAANR